MGAQSPARDDTAGTDSGQQDIKAEVVESKARQSTGEQTWRAEIHMPKPEAQNFGGKTRTMCVRGPLRTSRDQADRDAQDLEKAAVGCDTSKVRRWRERCYTTMFHDECS